MAFWERQSLTSLSSGKKISIQSPWTLLTASMGKVKSLLVSREFQMWWGILLTDLVKTSRSLVTWIEATPNSWRSTTKPWGRRVRQTMTTRRLSWLYSNVTTNSKPTLKMPRISQRFNNARQQTPRRKTKRLKRQLKSTQRGWNRKHRNWLKVNKR